MTKLGSCRQGPDGGGRYRSFIFLKKLKSWKNRKTKKIAAEVAPASEFFKAEEYHQCYYEKSEVLSSLGEMVYNNTKRKLLCDCI